MKPYVICHMGSSLEGRIVPRHWPKSYRDTLGEVYERIHRDLRGDAWLVGRVTMAEFAKAAPNPVTEAAPLPRSTWKAEGSGSGPYAIAVDQSGKLHLNTNRANGDHIIVVVTEAVADTYLAELRRDGISYIFGGETKLDLGVALEVLNAEFGIQRLLLEGGGGINGSFVEAGLIDEISLLIIPIVDGHAAMPTTFDGVTRLSQQLNLVSVERLESDIVYLRYKLE